jgi:hypothetical protein
MIHMKKIVMATVLAASSSIAFAGADAGADVVSAYIFRGATVNDEVNIQPTLNGSIDEGAFTGLSIGTWGNFNTDSSQFDEIDYYAGFALPMGNSPVTAELTYTEYTFPTSVDRVTAADGTTTSTGTEADREVGLASEYETDDYTLSALVAFGLEGPFLDEGLYFELGAETSRELTKDVEATAGVVAGYEAGDNVANTGVSHVTLSLGISHGIFAASVNYIVETDEDVLAVDEDFFASLGVAIDL